ncbi:MAG TPA: SagB/ThcOx family dehydrogenase [Proteiniphilum sp.]|nr:SagB/ThcOx family dehydrogenase [Proteiniphilum sp.]HPJ50439.1 SagB/ThcOx family dehydrogenase [Proteiniphilum sp.]HPR19765.1 SagB/ThcOx family dehydrogenase [Proteiniphilum sp.]
MRHLFLTAIVMMLGCYLHAQDLKLPAPERTGGKPLMEALNLRHSTRTFQDKELSLQQLSNLLWAANGFNRDDKRTAPTANNRQELELYLTTRDALYFYDARNHLLREVKKGDFRGATGAQDFVSKVALNLIFVVDMQKASGREYAFTGCGFVAQNIYLYCASEGLGSVVRGMFDKDKLHALLGLKETQEVLLTQSVGYPAD